MRGALCGRGREWAEGGGGGVVNRVGELMVMLMLMTCRRLGGPAAKIDLAIDLATGPR